MNTKITKFLTIVALALGVSGAWAERIALTDMVSAADNNSTITLTAGEYWLQTTNGKNLKFVGSGDDTDIYLNNTPDGNQGSGVTNCGNLEFEHVKLTGPTANYTGFTEAGSLKFSYVTFNSCFANWGNAGGDVSFYNCTFNQAAKGYYCVQELRCNSSGKWPLVTFLFDDCTFNCSADGRFINAYKQGGQSTKIEIVVKNCTFNNTGSSSKAVFNLKDTSDGCTIDLTFVGTNTANGPFPSSAPSALFQTTSTGWGTVYLKDDDDAEPIKIYENNAKTATWVDPNGYTPATAEPEVKVEVPETVPVKDAAGNAVSEAARESAAAVVETVKAQVAANKEAAKAESTGVTTIENTSAIVEALKTAAGAETAAQITEETEVKKFVAVEMTAAKVAVKDSTATFSSIVFEVKPMAEVTVGATTVKAEIPSTEFNNITFRLPLPNNFTKSAIVKHAGDPDRIVPVLGEENGRYVEVTVTHFSEFEVEPSDIVATVQSTAVLGIKRRTGISGGTDVAIAVPWLGTDGKEISVADLVTKDSLKDEDQLMVWTGAGYLSWIWLGSEWEAANDGPAADSVKVTRGMAAWLKRAGSTETTIVQVGQYSEEQVTTTPAKGASLYAAKHTLMINPKSEATPLSKIAGVKNDSIVVLNADGKIRYEHNGTTWCTKTTTTTTIAGRPITKTTLTPVAEGTSIPSDTGFWYISAGGAPTIAW